MSQQNGNMQYRFGPGDEIELYLSYEIDSAGYVLQIGDELEIKFLSNPELDRITKVLPDGTIILPGKGEIKASGFTISHIDSVIEFEYSSTLSNAKISVIPIKSNQYIESLQSLLGVQKARGFILQIEPDGKIALPFLYRIPAAGLTSDSLQKSIKLAYSKLSTRMHLSLVARKTINNCIYIFGEVRQPGTYQLDGLFTITQALAKAQCLMETSNLSSVLHISTSANGQVSKQFINVNKLLFKKASFNDIHLKQYDVIFVPKTSIAKANMFVDQYVNRMIPQVFRIGLGLNYDLY